jgi:hypothetical protein
VWRTLARRSAACAPEATTLRKVDDFPLYELTDTLVRAANVTEAVAIFRRALTFGVT